MAQTDIDLPVQTIRIADVGKSAKTAFEVVWDHDACAIAADILGATSVSKMKFSGHLMPSGKNDWEIKGMLGASVVQKCVVTLEPVKTRIDSPVLRRYLANPPVSDADEEVEMDWAEEEEPLEDVIDLAGLALEIIALEIPDYPRAEGAELQEAIFTEPGVEALTDDALRPFAGLADLKDKLEGK
jgi:uncharacterized metal-binding protein YceD (DUF177 family)